MRTTLAAGLVALATVASAAQPQFWNIEGATEFLGGDLQGLSVDANGHVRLAPAAPVLHNPSCPYVWSLARDAAGAIYAGTGNDGQVFRLIGHESKMFYDAPELEVHAVAVAKDGRVFVGSSPDGKVDVIGKDGASKELFDPEERYIWALAFDANGNLLVATGAEGKVYRVDSTGKGTVILEGPETHIISLATDAAGRIYAGSSPSGIVYRIETDAKVTVLQDTAYREIKALALGKDGSVYAAALQGREDLPAVIAATPAPGSASVGEAMVTVTEAVVGIVAPVAPAVSVGSRTTETPRAGQVKGAVLRLLPSGETDTMWSSTEEVPYSLLLTAGGLYLGTGNKGKLYRIADDRTWTMITTLPAEQITALEAGTGGRIVAATSNPGMLYDLGSAPSQEGSFVSKVKDTETASSWGRLRWHAEGAGGAVRLATRSGNTSSPDSTWSDWSALATHDAGEKIASPSARFLQVKAVLSGKGGETPVLDSIDAAFLQRNLRPQVTSVTVHAAGEVFQKPLTVTADAEILGFEAPPGDTPDRQAAHAMPTMSPMTYSRKVYQKGLQTFSWKAEDPNGDTLVYDVEYRPAHGTTFHALRKGLTESVLVWDTSTVPNGRYVVRVVARDSPSNPDALALSGDKESPPFDVDNTPPVVGASLAAGRRIHATAKDDSSLIRRAEYSLDGGAWEEVHPTDGINDSQEESYDFAPRGLSDGAHVVVVRATDLLGNASTARVDIP